MLPFGLRYIAFCHFGLSLAFYAGAMIRANLANLNANRVMIQMIYANLKSVFDSSPANLKAHKFFATIAFLKFKF